MDSVNDIAIHFSINGVVAVILQILVVIACIIINIKYRKSFGAKLLLAGSILSFLALLIRFILPVLAAANSSDSLIKSQIIISYFDSLTYLFFAIGLIIFAINDLKKPVTKSHH